MRSLSDRQRLHQALVPLSSGAGDVLFSALGPACRGLVGLFGWTKDRGQWIRGPQGRRIVQGWLRLLALLQQEGILVPHGRRWRIAPERVARLLEERESAGTAHA